MRIFPRRKSVFLATCISFSFLFTLSCGKGKSSENVDGNTVAPTQNLRGGACYFKEVYGQEILDSQCMNYDASLAANQAALFEDACEKMGFNNNLSVIFTEAPCDTTESKASCQRPASGSAPASTRYYYFGDFTKNKTNCESEGGTWSEK